MLMKHILPMERNKSFKMSFDFQGKVNWRAERTNCIVKLIPKPPSMTPKTFMKTT